MERDVNESDHYWNLNKRSDYRGKRSAGIDTKDSYGDSDRQLEIV